MVNDSLLPQTKRLLRRFGLKARKGLGQHFLVDAKVLHAVSAAADLSPDDVVVEVGPGLGILTKELATKAGQVIAIELDDRLAANLREMLAGFKNVTVINDNVLNVDLQALFRDRPGPAVSRYKVVANLPYYITSPALRHFLEAALKPEIMVVMVQKEVARVIAAEPGKRSVLSVAVQFYGKPKIVSYVSASSFYPVPEVDSAILRVDLHPEPVVDVNDAGSFFKMVRAGFTAPRKQIVNSLAQGLGLTRDEVFSGLEKAKLAPQRRAETLTLEEWAELWRVFKEG